jgi:hypothetical protein
LDGGGGHGQAAGRVETGLEVDPELGRGLGVVAALVGAAALGAGQRAQEAGLGGSQGGAQVKGVGKVCIALGGWPDVLKGAQTRTRSVACWFVWDGCSVG